MDFAFAFFSFQLVVLSAARRERGRERGKEEERMKEKGMKKSKKKRDASVFCQLE